MLKKLIIIVLILLVIGLYFKPQITKSIIKATGHAALDVGKKTVDKITGSEIVKNVTETVKEDIQEEIKEKVKTFKQK